MRLVEPKLFQKYQAIYKHPRKKNMILDSILSTLNRKRIALRKMAAVIKQKRLFSSLDASSVFQHHVRNRCSESFSRTCKSTTKTESKRTTNAICFCRRVWLVHYIVFRSLSFEWFASCSSIFVRHQLSVCHVRGVKRWSYKWLFFNSTFLLFLCRSLFSVLKWFQSSQPIRYVHESQ